ncbi:hypothetical protein OAG68_01410 [bacterium]|nr:hypothetical protein [bacterium]
MTVPTQGLVFIKSPPGEVFTEEEAHQMCTECDGSLVTYGSLDLWDELQLAHQGKPSSHQVKKKAKAASDKNSDTSSKN